MVNHCMHGPDAVIEEILDWRPFDYYSDRTTMGFGGPSMLSTIELEPTPTGTTVHLRFAKPTKAKDREILATMAADLDAALKASVTQLSENVEIETRTRLAGRSEPSLPERRAADGFLESIQPIEMLD